MKKRIASIATFSLVALSLIFSTPIAALAHSDSNDRDDDDDRPGARLALGHYKNLEKRFEQLKKRWENLKEREEKKDEKRERKEERRRGHGTATSTPSTPSPSPSPSPTSTPAPAPNISNIMAFIGTSTIRFAWNTKVPADSQIYFSTTSPVTIGASTTQSLSDSARVTNHSLNLTGLATSTTYHFLIRSATASSTRTTNQFSITTGS